MSKPGRRCSTPASPTAWSSSSTKTSADRSIEQAGLEPSICSVVCDHTDDDAVQPLFDRIADEQSRLDVLVNNAWGGYEQMVEDGRSRTSAL